MRVIDIFSGCGGISLGFKRAGFDVIMGIDNNKWALQTFKENFKDAIIYDGDISQLDPFKVMEELGLEQGDLECLVGGPPCQGFSKNVPASNRFFNDERNLLVTHFLRFVEAFRPKLVLMENVAELAKAYENRYTEIIVEELQRLGYNAEWNKLLAADYGVPQMRRRAFFLASRISDESLFPEPTHISNIENIDLFNSNTSPYNSVWDAISDLPSLKNGEGNDIDKYPSNPITHYQHLMRENSDGNLYNHKARKLSDIQFQRVSSIKEGQGIKDLPQEIRPKSGYSGAYGRLWRNKPAPTITCWVFHPGSGRFSHPVDERVITIREAARIQSFDDGFKFLGSYNEQARQVGNAVPPLLARRIAEKFKHALITSTVNQL